MPPKKMKTAAKSQKRCRFYTACRRQATTRRWHTFLKKYLNVCDHCAKSNTYLVELAPPETL
jgi:hypothetical protein